MTSATQDVTPINVSLLPNGTLTYSVTLTNGAGTGTAATATATLDSGPLAAIRSRRTKPQSRPPTPPTAGFTFAGATVGRPTATPSLQQQRRDLGHRHGNVTSATQDVTPINVSALPNGTLTYSVTLTNGAGTGTAETTTATLTQTAP